MVKSFQNSDFFFQVLEFFFNYLRVVSQLHEPYSERLNCHEFSCFQVNTLKNLCKSALSNHITFSPANTFATFRGSEFKKLVFSFFWRKNNVFSLLYQLLCHWFLPSCPTNVGLGVLHMNRRMCRATASHFNRKYENLLIKLIIHAGRLGK